MDLDKSADLISWDDKAVSLFMFATNASNFVRDTDNGAIKAGGMLGVPILLSFAIECSLKSLLVQQGTPITKRLWTHKVHRLFCELQPETRQRASSVYAAFVDSELDPRVKLPPANDLEDLLKYHDDMFTQWRYHMGSVSRYYDVVMFYACVSILTLAQPERPFTISSKSMPQMTIENGQVVST